jgi:nitrogen regulatory protein P-II 1
MNEITAIIQSHVLSRVMRALHDLPHFPGVTMIDVHGQGRGRGQGGAYRPTEDDFTFHRKHLLIITCEHEHTESIVQTIVRSAHTGNKGDGIVTVKTVDRVIRIRTGETAGKAV